ncbi:MAG: hypothetical protein SFT81_06845 [Candidatus Caenarcaniphilales bacterium]|nr:hypothetical protein [Candidatus Caenarcaniphilales bacterium]
MNSLVIKHTYRHNKPNKSFASKEEFLSGVRLGLGLPKPQPKPKFNDLVAALLLGMPKENNGSTYESYSQSIIRESIEPQARELASLFFDCSVIRSIKYLQAVQYQLAKKYQWWGGLSFAPGFLMDSHLRSFNQNYLKDIERIKQSFPVPLNSTEFVQISIDKLPETYAAELYTGSLGPISVLSQPHLSAITHHTGIAHSKNELNPQNIQISSKIEKDIHKVPNYLPPPLPITQETSSYDRLDYFKLPCWLFTTKVLWHDLSSHGNIGLTILSLQEHLTERYHFINPMQDLEKRLYDRIQIWMEYTVLPDDLNFDDSALNFLFANTNLEIKL